MRNRSDCGIEPMTSEVTGTDDNFEHRSYHCATLDSPITKIGLVKTYKVDMAAIIFAECSIYLGIQHEMLCVELEAGVNTTCMKW
jgi:hypothetical protein